jgi:uncharacterized protein (DUF488 family)
VIVYTVGHSTRSIEEFLAIVADAGVARVVDVRAFPMSRRHPQFNRDALSASRVAAGVGYRHMPPLMGRRGATKGAPSRTDSGGSRRSAIAADYAATPAFAAAIDALERLARERPTAFMCAEALWWQCHRRLIVDLPAARGWTVMHPLARGERQEGAVTPGAIALDDGTIEYPALQPGLLD